MQPNGLATLHWRLRPQLSRPGAGRNAAGSERDATTVDPGGTRPGRPAMRGVGTNDDTAGVLATDLHPAPRQAASARIGPA